MKTYKKITLELNSINSYELIEVHRGDVASRVFNIDITVDGAIIQLTENMRATVNATVNNVIVAEDAEMDINVADNYIVLKLTEKMLSLPGILIVDLVLTEVVEEETEIITAETLRFKIGDTAINENSKFEPLGGTIRQQLNNKINNADGSVLLKHLAQEILDLIGTGGGSSGGGVTLSQVTALLNNYAKSAELAKKEDVLNKVDAFDNNFADASNTLYPTVTAIKKYLSDYYYNHQETYSQDEIDELLESLSGSNTNLPLPLTGKTVVCFGDSLIGMYRGDDSATAYLAKQTGATVYNVGFGGCRMSIHPTSGYAEFCMWTLADAVTSGDWTAQDAAAESGSDYFPAQLELLKSIDFNNVDIAIIHYGTNDFPVGKAIDSSSNPYNCDTLCGALRYSIDKLLTAYPTLRIFVSLPVYRFWTADDGTVTYSDTYTNGSGNTLLDVCTAIKSVANEYNLPVIDGYHGMGVNKLNASAFLEDGVHHNIAGRERFGEYLGASLIAQGADMISTGNSGATDEPATSYTNQIPISTDTDGSVYNAVGYKAGYRLSSTGGESAMTGMSVTGFIPCSYLDVVYLKNVGFNVSDSTAGNQRICFYDTTKAFIGLTTASAVSSTLLGVFDDDGNLSQFVVTNLSDVDMTTVAYFRICGYYIGDDSIITVNEEIV